MVKDCSSHGTGADVVVVGGGALGLSTAHSLLRAGLTVLSVYPASPTERPSASRAAGAMLGAFGEVTGDDGELEEIELAFRIDAQRRYSEWLAEIVDLAGQPVHESCGTFIVANNDGVNDRGSVRRMKQKADIYSELAEWVDPEDVPGLVPNPHHAPALCLHLANEHAVDADDLLAALRTAAAAFVGWRHLDAIVSRVQRDGDGWRVTMCDGSWTSAGQLVVAAGSRTFELLGEELRLEAGLPEMYFGKGVSCLLRGAPILPSTLRTPNRAFACGIHLVPRAGGLLYIGATNCLGRDHAEFAGVQPGELHNLLDEILHQLSTDVREARIVELREGYRPIVAHRRPVIGATMLPGLTVATGTYRHGVLMAPLVGDIVRATIAGADGAPNPFPATYIAAPGDPDSLAKVGIRDIISFLHEPRGELPYNRAEQLRKYVTALFHAAVGTDEATARLRDDIRRELRDAPFNETMHRLFYDIIERTNAEVEGPVAPTAHPA